MAGPPGPLGRRSGPMPPKEPPALAPPTPPSGPAAPAAPAHVVWQSHRRVQGGGGTGRYTAQRLGEFTNLSIQDHSGSASGSSSLSTSATPGGAASSGAGSGSNFAGNPNAVHHICFQSSSSEAGSQDRESSQTRAASPEKGKGIAPEWMASIPEDQNGKLMSLGSRHHPLGTCKPCLFVRTTVGCANGVACPFCHFKHKRSEGRKPCKSKRDRYRRIVAAQELERVVRQSGVLQEPPEAGAPTAASGWQAALLDCATDGTTASAAAAAAARPVGGGRGHADDGDGDEEGNSGGTSNAAEEASVSEGSPMRRLMSL